MQLPTSEFDRIIIKDSMILTMDSEFKFFTRGNILISGSTIYDVGNVELTNLGTEWDKALVIEGKGKLVMPGLINTHTHVPMTIFRGYADDLPLHEWLYQYIFPIESEFINPENVETGTRLAVAEMLRSGTTTFNDMYYHVDVIAKVIDEMGMRAVLSEAVIDFPAPNSPEPLKGLRTSEELIKKWNTHPRITISVSAHAPYSCSDWLIQEAKRLADQYNVPFNIHLAETRMEFDESLMKTGFTPVGHLEKLGVLSSNVIAAHGVHVTQKDIEILATHGVSIAHNPECNMKLASGVSPVPQLLSAGVKVGFGTDGVASNNNMDMFEEMNSAAILHKIHWNDPTLLNARTVIEMATIGGARVLGMENEIGSIEKEKKADLIILNMNQPHAHPVYNIYSLLVYSMQGSDVETVIIDGKPVMFNREINNLDETYLYEKVDQVAARIKVRGDEMFRERLKNLNS